MRRRREKSADVFVIGSERMLDEEDLAVELEDLSANGPSRAAVTTDGGVAWPETEPADPAGFDEELVDQWIEESDVKTSRAWAIQPRWRSVVTKRVVAAVAGAIASASTTRAMPCFAFASR